MKRFIPIFVAVTVLNSGAILADDAQQRVENQQERIENGINNGRLNEAEAKRLERGQNKVNAAEARAAADGTVTGKEAKRIDNLQDRESRRIKRLKHNRRRG